MIGPVREVHVWAERAWGLQDAASAEKFDKPHGFYNGIQIVERFKEEMPFRQPITSICGLGPAPARPFHETYFPGPRWYRWWDVGNGTMSDLGSHDNDVPYTGAGHQAAADDRSDVAERAWRTRSWRRRR